MPESPVTTQDSAWLQLDLEVPEHLADDAGAELIAAGAAGVQIIDSQTKPPPAAAGVTPPPVPGAGCALLRVTYGATDDQDTVSESVRAVLEPFGIDVTGATWSQQHDDDWRERWKEFFVPITISDRLRIVPDWHEDDESTASHRIVIRLEPGMAFGTGQHATTQLCLRIIDRHISAAVDSLLDVGCGSGILAIAAAKLGVRNIVAIDNDPQALRAARENLERNGVTGRIQISDTPASALTGQFAWVIANMLSPILIDLADALVARVAENGRLVLSGLLAEQEEEVTAAFGRAHAALTIVDRFQEEDWLALILDRG